MTRFATRDGADTDFIWRRTQRGWPCADCAAYIPAGAMSLDLNDAPLAYLGSDRVCEKCAVERWGVDRPAK